MRREIVEVATLAKGRSRLARAVRKGKAQSTRALVKQAQRALRKAGVL